MSDKPMSRWTSKVGPPGPPISATRSGRVGPYMPRADFYLWFIPMVSRLLLATAMTPIVLLALGKLGLIDVMIIPAAKAYLLSFKPFLKTAATGSFSWLIGLCSQLAVYVFLAMGCAVAWFTVKILNRPNTIEIHEQGLRICQTIRQEDGSTALSSVGHVDFSQVKGIEIRRPKTTRSNLDYQFVFQGKGGGEFVLRYGDILNPSERDYLVSVLEERFPADIDEEAMEPFLQSSDKESYTALWLKELAASPKRDKLTPLLENATINQGRYTILSKIGMGGQGTVYLAADNRPGNKNREVVLKEFLLPVFPDTRVRKAAALRFQEEAALLSKLDHPQIVKFHELFLEDHRAYLVLEKLEGRTLKELIEEQGPLPAEETSKLVTQMCRILAYLHDQTPPVVHRDFTPDNLILHEDGKLRLIDFSVAQAVASNVTGSVVGKPHYISPEQFRGKATNQSDIYSLGATAYFLVTGQEPEPITNLKPQMLLPDLDPRLEKVIEKCTKLDCAHRYQHVQEILRDLA